MKTDSALSRGCQQTFDEVESVRKFHALPTLNLEHAGQSPVRRDHRFCNFSFFVLVYHFAAMPVPDYLLSESATGYALYEVTESEEIGARTREFLETINDISRFSNFVKLVSFVPFKNAAQALENINDVSEGTNTLSPLHKTSFFVTVLTLHFRPSQRTSQIIPGNGIAQKT